MKTFRLEDGKYEIDRDDQTGLMLAARRNGEPWPEGLVDLQFAKVVHAMLNRIDELEGVVQYARRKIISAQCCHPNAVSTLLEEAQVELDAQQFLREGSPT